MENGTSRKIALLVTSVASFVTPFLGSSVNIALPSIGKEFSMSALLMTWVSTVYFLSAAVFTVPFGRLADIKGRKRIFILGVLVYVLSSLTASLSFSGFMVISLRAVQGLGAAMIFATGIAILTSVYPPQERGRVLGINATATYLGLSMGPFLGGALTQSFGWRSVFLVNVPLGVTLLCLTIFKLKGEWAEARGDTFDIPGSVTYGLALILTMYGISVLPELRAAGFILAGIIGFAGFIFWENRVKSPILPVKLFKENTAFTFSSLAALANYSATHGIGFLLSLYLQNVKGFTPRQAGLILLLQPLTQAAFATASGRLSDRVPPRLIASAGMVVTTSGLFLLTFLDRGTAIYLIAANLLLLGFGLALFSAPNQNAIMSSVAGKFYGIASGTLGTVRLMGQILSLGTIMLSFALYMGKAMATPAEYATLLRSMRAVFGVFGVLSFGGIFASLKGGRARVGSG